MAKKSAFFSLFGGNSKFSREPISIELRQEVLKRAGNRCQTDGCCENEVLDIHHIDCDSSNSKMENLVVLCPTHHRKVHKVSLKLNEDISKKTDAEKIVNFIEDTMNLFKTKKKKRKKSLMDKWFGF